MSGVTFDVKPATPQKRTHDECIVVNDQQDATSMTRSASVEQNITSRHGSPTPSTASSLTDLSSADASGSVTTPKPFSVPGSAAPASKKRKLTFIERKAEKAAKQREKEEKTRIKTEEKARQAEERQRQAEEKENAKRAKELEKAEEKAKKEAERKEKDAKKEAERQKREDEKAQREAEKLKKERSQMRLGAFFGKPKPEATPPSTPDDVSEGASSRRSSIASIEMERPVFETKFDNRPTNPEYERWILPFFVPEYTKLAPYNRYKTGRQPRFDVSQVSNFGSYHLHEHFGRPRKRMRMTIPVREVISNMQASVIDVVELDSPALSVLARTSYKCLQFKEDVRPPYQGTYTRRVSPRTNRKISRNPFTRSLPDTNYDYDSEAEWEPPGEDDEDLNEDDEMSDADDNEDEMADFLDDADDGVRKRGLLVDMEPISTGLCWMGESCDDNGLSLEQYRMGVLHDSVIFPIDPFSTTHWIDETKPKPAIKTESSAVMQPPRQPLSSLVSNALPFIKQELGIDGKPVPTHQKAGTSSNKQLKLIEPDLMPAFKKAIDGSDLTKAGLIEILKKQFPKCSKDAIKDTLGVVALRVGKKEAEKKWQLVEAS